MLKIVWKAHKTKIFINVWTNFEGKIFQIFLVLCAFWTIPGIFCVKNFEKFKILPIRSVRIVLRLIRSLTYPVSDGLCPSKIRSLYDSL
jgi:hypothetical protein